MLKKLVFVFMDFLGHLNTAFILNSLQETGCAGVDTVVGSSCLGRHLQ